MQLVHWQVNSTKRLIMPVLAVFPYWPCPYTLAEANDIKFCCFVWFFAPRSKLTNCLWTTFWGNFQLDINRQSEVRLKKRRLRFSFGMRLPVQGPLHRVAWPNDYIVHRLHKLGFCSVSFNATLALVSQLCKNLDRASIGSVAISALLIHTSKSQRDASLLLCLVFPSRNESHQVSLNNILRRPSTRHKSKTGGRIDAPSTPLVF
jgi:hypothetical protein